VAVLALVALAIGLAVPMLTNTSAKDRIAADPAPALFSDSAIHPVDAWVRPQDPRAHQLMSKWWQSHGRQPDDKAFLIWLGRTFPKPPDTAARKDELALLQAQKRRHTPSGVRAATWLEANGKKDIWKLYAHDQAEWLPAKAGDARKADVKAMLKMSKEASDMLAKRYPSSAPYVMDRRLLDATSKDRDPINKLKSEKRPCPCSYPSRHAVKAAAARTYLGAYQPHMVAQYRWMEDEIDWSRIYMAGHVPSDLAGGALLGDMVGEYFVVTRGQLPMPESSL
jgi:hypothetical protein